MQKPMGRIETIAASGRGQVPGSIPLIRARTLTVTARMTFGASIDADATIEIYYSPDGTNWDTLTYTTYAVTYTSGGTVQQTIIIDPPEHGHIAVKILNGSSADTLTDVVAWYSIQSYYDWPAQSKGEISTADPTD